MPPQENQFLLNGIKNFLGIFFHSSFTIACDGCVNPTLFYIISLLTSHWSEKMHTMDTLLILDRGDQKDMSADANNSPDLILELLGKVPFFQKFSTYEKKRIAGNNACFEKHPPGSKLIKEGNTDTSFFILIGGSVSVLSKGEVIIGLGTGEFFGEMAFLTNAPRNTTIIANEDVIAVRVDQELMGRLSPEIREKIKDQIILKLVERLEKTTQRLRVRM